MLTLTKAQIAYRLFQVGVPGHACASFEQLANPTRLEQCLFSESREHPAYYAQLAKVVNRAFTWSSTPQGHAFWNKIYKFLLQAQWPEQCPFVEVVAPKKCSLPIVEINKEKRHV